MNELEGFDLKRSGVTSKHYILGRRYDRSSVGVLRIGKYLAIDGSTGSDVFADCLGPHAILICGKRGYGKSYTMGTLIEELALQTPPVSDNIASIIIDSMGIFWTLGYANSKEKDILSTWGMEPGGLDVQIFTTGRSAEEFAGMGIRVSQLKIPAGSLSGTDWCTLFNVEPVHPVGILITRIVQGLKDESGHFSIEDISDRINADERADNDSKNAALNALGAAESWGLFHKEGVDVDRLILPGRGAVIDISGLPDISVQSVVVRILARMIYQERVRARKQYEFNKMTGSEYAVMPMVWMFIDEAHLFLPVGGHDMLINQWLRQGRQPGLSLVMATQRPSALHPDVLSQSDIIICHRLTSQDDINALEKVRPTYMRQSIADSIRKMGDGKGVALIIDDTSEASHLVQMRPRLSWHGGDEPSALGP